MGNLTVKDLKEKFDTPTKDIEVESWGGTVTIKKLTIEEQNRVTALMLSDTTSDEIENGKVKVNIGNASSSTILRVSLALVKPKMKPSELGQLSPEAMGGIEEIAKVLDEWDTPKKSKGKS